MSRLLDLSRSGHHRHGSERGHRTLTVLRKGGRIVTIPLAPRTAPSLDLAIGQRLDGPIFRRAEGQRLDGHGASRLVRRIAKSAGIAKPIRPGRPDCHWSRCRR
jgi:integrase/recombinase XerD